MRHLTGGVSVITAGRGGTLGHDGDLGVVAVDRSADADRQHQPGGLVLAADPALRLLRCQYPYFRSDRIAERFAGKDGLKGAERFAGAEWTTRASGVPLLVGALAAIDCGVEESSSAIRMRLIGGCWMFRSRRAAPRWPIGRAATCRSTRTRCARLAEVSCRHGRPARDFRRPG